MKSMTGFFSIEKNVGNYIFSINLKSYNGKFLDYRLKIPDIFSNYEFEIRNLISNYISRGNIYLSVFYKEVIPHISFTLNPNYLESISRIKDVLKNNNLNIKDELNLGDLLSLRGALIIDENNNQEESYGILKGILEETLISYNKHRSFEGENTKSDLTYLLGSIKNDSILIKKSQEELNSKLFLNIKENMLKFIDNYSETNILEEAAKMAIRFDINEELIRLESHIESFSANMEKDVSGKALEFIAQEMHREITTMGNKIFDLENRSIVLGMKLNLEKIKEQVRNIE